MSINRHTPEDNANSRPEREKPLDSPNKPTGEATSPENAPQNVTSKKTAGSAGAERPRANADDIKRPEKPAQQVSAHGLSDNKMPGIREDAKVTRRAEPVVENE